MKESLKLAKGLVKAILKVLNNSIDIRVNIYCTQREKWTSIEIHMSDKYGCISRRRSYTFRTIEVAYEREY